MCQGNEKLFIAILVLTSAGNLFAADAIEPPKPEVTTAIGWRTNYRGVYEKATPPTEWSDTKNVVWKTPSKKFSNSSPIIVGDKIFTTGEPSSLVCLNKTTGAVLWNKTNDLEAGSLPKAQDTNGYASATPTCDGKNIYAVFASGVVVCYDLAGTLVWQKTAKMNPFGWGHCASPLLIDGKLVVELGVITAFKADTGEVAWEVPNRVKDFYGSPIAATIAGKPVVITPDGKILNSADGKPIEINLPKLDYSTPILVDKNVFFIQTNSVAYELPADLDGKPKELWKATLKSDRYYSSPLYCDGLIYAVNQGSYASILDAKTGEVVAQKDLGLKKTMYASITKAGELLYYIHEDGTTLVVKPGKDFDIVATNTLEQVRGTPVFEAGRMYIRTWKNLYCIGK